MKFRWVLRLLFKPSFYRFIWRRTAADYPMFLLVEQLRKRTINPRFSDDLQLRNVEQIFIGKNVLIEKGCLLSCGENGEIHIGDNTIIGNNAIVYAGNGTIKIGESCDVGLNVVITAQSRDLMQNPLEKRESHSLSIGAIEIGKGCYFGSNAVVLAGSVLGDYCNVTAGTVVGGKYPDKTSLIGNPARSIPRIEFE